MADEWKRVDEVLQSVLLRPPGERDTFVRQACGGDSALEREVRSLLASYEQAGSFLEDPAIHTAARALADEQSSGGAHRPEPLETGRRLGDYTILGPIGAGGMGEVYKARDTRLSRDVAIKVLPAFVSSDLERLRRFEQEARAAAALSHPNILAVFQMGSNEGAPYLVSELLEGSTLREQLQRGPMPLSKVIECGVQIARGLAAAHGKAIVHRDLKPENLFVVKDGRVKILDFGLARLVEHPWRSLDTNLPTKPDATEPGMVIGTVGYMSPEQVRGHTADHRADIFAFGAVLYEMLTGTRAFQKATSAETMSAILNEDPPALSRLSPAASPALERVVRRCLEKSPEQRFQSTSDLAFALEALSTHSGSAEALPTSFAAGRRERIAWILASVALMATVGLAASRYFAARPQEVRPVRLSMTLPEGWSLALSSSVIMPTSLVVSPDGRRVAIVARRENGPATILMRELDSPAQPLAGTEGATSLFWSPDSRFIGFFADGKIKKVDMLGGVPTVVCDATPPFGGGTWSREGTIVFSMREKETYRLWKVSDTGGQRPVALEEAPASQGNNAMEIWPWFLPDGRTLLYATPSGSERVAVFAAKLDAPGRTKVVDSESVNVQYAGGYLLYMRAAALVAQPFDVERLAVTGGPVAVAERVLRQGVIPGYGLFSASQNGVLAYQPGTEDAPETRLAWVDGEGRTIGTIGDAANYRGVALSHDETRVVAVVGMRGKPPALFIVKLSNGVRTQFTFDPEQGGFPIWSPDDRFIDFSAPSNGVPLAAYRKPSNGAGASEQIFPDAKDYTLPFDRSPDGSLVYRTGTKSPNLWVLPGSGDRTPFRLASTPDDKRIAKFSPNGRWVAYVSNDSSGQNVWVVPFVERTGAGSVKWRISGADGGTLPQWSADSSELFYVSSSRMVTAVQVKGDEHAFQPGTSKALFPIRVSQLEGGYAGWPYAPSKDGRRFLVIQSAEATSRPAAAEPVIVELNWPAGIGR